MIYNFLLFIIYTLLLFITIISFMVFIGLIGIIFIEKDQNFKLNYLYKLKQNELVE
jgi:hypothetical protein